ncbi:DJ-1/PfpI family protein [Sphingomonas olei]
MTMAAAHHPAFRPDQDRRGPLRVAFLLFPNVTQLDLTGPAQVLSRLGGDARLDLVWKTLDPVPTDAGFSILPTATFADVPTADILCIPGGIGVNQVIADDAAMAWVEQIGASAQWVTSVCTGSIILGVRRVSFVAHAGRRSRSWGRAGREIHLASRHRGTLLPLAGEVRLDGATFAAFSAQTTPELTGELFYIGADRKSDERTGATFFEARLRVPESEVQKLGNLKLKVGMPVEAYMQTGRRSLMSYLVKPLVDQFNRAFRQ